MFFKIFKKLFIHENAETITDYIDMVSNVPISNNSIHPVVASHLCAVLFTLIFSNLIELIEYCIFAGTNNLSTTIATNSFTIFVMAIICIDILCITLYLIAFSKIIPTLAINTILRFNNYKPKEQ